MKRVLFVSYYFPPSGGSGVQRTSKFVKYLPEFGWEATILTVDPNYAAYSDLDVSIESDIPQETRIIRTHARDPYAMYSRFMGRKKKDVVGVGFIEDTDRGRREKIARWIRANFFIPDARVGWISYAVRAASHELTKRSYNALFTTGPPHSTHLVGERLRRKFQTPWIADLRDGWPSDSYGHLFPVSAIAASLDRRRRAKAFGRADRIITVSKNIAESTSQCTNTPVRIIPNGFDMDDFVGVQAHLSDNFTIVFTGHMPEEQNPETLWTVLQKKAVAGAWENVRVHLIGNISGTVRKSIVRLGLEKLVKITPYVTHTEAIRWMCGGSLLLLPINRVPNPDGIVTGKLYEYLASGNPILCVGPVGGDAAEFIRLTNAGQTFEHGDSEGVEKMIECAYAAWCSGNPMHGAKKPAVETYSRKSQTEMLVSILEEISG